MKPRNKKVELEIELDFVIEANKRGVKAIKFIDPSTTGAPDRIVLCPRKHTFFIEFKKPGEEPRAKQRLYIKELMDLGYKVYTIDNLPDAIMALEHELFLSTLQ